MFKGSLIDHGIGLGKYKIGAYIKDVNLQKDNSKGNGNEIWSKTDVGFGYGIAVDSSGNVYCAHYVGSGDKAIRKLDSATYYKIIS